MSHDQPRSGLLDKVAGRAKQALGGITGNDDLTEEGRLQQAKARLAAEAQRLEASADHVKEATDLTAATEANRIERERVDAELAAEQQEERADLQAAAEEARVRQEAARAEAAVDSAAAAQEAALDRAEHQVAVEHGEAVVNAAQTEREARVAEAAAEALDAAQENLDQRTGG